LDPPLFTGDLPELDVLDLGAVAVRVGEGVRVTAGVRVGEGVRVGGSGVEVGTKVDVGIGVMWAPG
jgi:hypothetical protein